MMAKVRYRLRTLLIWFILWPVALATAYGWFLVLWDVFVVQPSMN